MNERPDAVIADLHVGLGDEAAPVSKPREPIPQVIFIAPPDFAGLEEIYDARRIAHTDLEVYVQKISRMRNNAHQRLAVIDWMDVLVKESGLEQERAETGTSVQGGTIPVREREMEVKLSTRAQIARGVREASSAHTTKNPYNTTIIELARLGNRLERAESDLIAVRYTGINRSLHSPIPGETEIHAQAMGAVANTAQQLYRENFIMRKRPA